MNGVLHVIREQADVVGRDTELDAVDALVGQG